MDMKHSVSQMPITTQNACLSEILPLKTRIMVQKDTKL